MPRDPTASPPAISVLTPAFDVARFVGDAVASLRAQTARGWEMVVVDDGSSDGTAAAARAAARGDPRIRVLSQPNQGVSAARGRALAEARGQLVVFLDADDWLAPDALARLHVALAAAPGAVGAHGGHAVVAEAARPGDAPVRFRPGPLPQGDLLERLLVENLFANGGQLLLRRAALERAGGFRRDLRYAEDWECWIRLALQGPFVAAAGTAPVLFVRERRGSAYRRMAPEDAAVAPAMAAIWDNPALLVRLGARAPALRRRAEAENAWITGRELIRHGAWAAGLARLRASVVGAPGPKRAALLVAAHALPLLPRALHGPFGAYPARP